jgi:nifR3 family TIM-barrel protein
VIGGRSLSSRLVLAPLSKLGNVAFRELVAGFGGFGLLFSEMSGARAVRHDVPGQGGGYLWQPEELGHLVCQIFDNDPDTMAAAAAKIAARGFFGVDINFGCSVAAVCKRGAGAALLKTPDLAVAIVAAVRAAVNIPVFVKFRTGWEDRPEPAVLLARRFQAAGADALTFHPRVAPDRRTRPPRWDYIAAVKAAVDIPVFGNGDVFSAADCRRMMAETACDGVALGRMALARPWVFAQWALGKTFSKDIYHSAVHDYARLLDRHFAPTAALRRFNRFMAYYCANFRFGHALYAAVSRYEHLNDAVAAFDRFYEKSPDTVARPQITLMR